MRRDHVASTLTRRHFYVICPLGVFFIVRIATSNHLRTGRRTAVCELPMHMLCGSIYISLKYCLKKPLSRKQTANICCLRTTKISDQTARMCKLVRAFTVCIYAEYFFFACRLISIFFLDIQLSTTHQSWGTAILYLCCLAMGQICQHLQLLRNVQYVTPYRLLVAMVTRMLQNS